MTTVNPSPTPSSGAVEVRRAADRPHTRMGWLDSWHSFSFGGHYDPANTGHGLLLVSNDDRVAPASGFGMHPHRDMEIVTWMLSGEIQHRDTAGNEGLIRRGIAQRMSAGTGLLHSEENASPDVEAHFVQMWVVPDTEGVAPGYEQTDVTQLLEAGGLVAVAGGEGSGAAIGINQRDAVLWAGWLRPGEEVAVPDAPHVHLFVAVGSAELVGTGELREGDAARLTEVGSPALVAGPDGAEVLIWATA
jgi:redox-sensitive bicupin YhaK (pirin superfamily)